MNHTASLSATGASRRQFLLAGSAAIAGALLLGGDLLGTPTGLELLAGSPGPRIPVAYIEGSSGARSLAAALAGSRRAVPAAGMPAATSLAGSRARVVVRGFASAAHSSAGTDVLLDAHVPSPAHRDQTIPFYAFTFRGGPAGSQSQSSPSRLAVPRGDELRIGFQLAASAGPGAATVFTSRPRRGLPTLQDGVYLFGLQPGMWSSGVTLPADGDAAWAALPSLVVVVEAEAAE